MRVLYVDDEPDIRVVAVMCLQLNDNFEVQECASGMDALQVARDWQPDLVLLDVMMPEMDGPMTRIALRDDPATAHIPVVFVTARTQPSEVERLLELDVTGVIAKPFDPMSLAEQVSTLMGWKN
ncbi:response regulator [Devosia neptuniae]|jgi:two-component system OmpR family response regulator|uniref:response regulator n=1 Tax=Devosia TaxID=46913 RepID=UPI0022AF0F24|nr:response regulator [Devosia neptuniae]MCZ4345401.1 response regulator [Devosia neptuniae]|tara:strand:+ start:19609 stop:19980 length:372 start_codon:yes stop_codon:yes gene_type:complete